MLHHLLAGVALLLTLLAAAGCGRKGPPRPLGEGLLEAPADLTLRQLGERLLLAWTLPEGGPAGFHIYKRSYLPGNECPECPDRGAPWRRVDLDYLRQTERQGERLWTWDDHVAPGTGYRYRVVSLAPSGREGAATVASRVATLAPASPAELNAEPLDRSVRLAWPATDPLTGTLLGYRIYRAREERPFPPAPLHAGLLAVPQYEDFAVQNGVPYRYAVRTVVQVEGQRVESSLSPHVRAVPSPPGKKDLDSPKPGS